MNQLSVGYAWSTNMSEMITFFKSLKSLKKITSQSIAKRLVLSTRLNCVSMLVLSISLGIDFRRAIYSNNIQFVRRRKIKIHSKFLRWFKMMLKMLLTKIYWFLNWFNWFWATVQCTEYTLDTQVVCSVSSCQLVYVLN